jgi:hypothetical protein
LITARQIEHGEWQLPTHSCHYESRRRRGTFLIVVGPIHGSAARGLFLGLSLEQLNYAVKSLFGLIR